ncbi:hypothetical protein ACQUJT_07055, partial [Ralstonia pseudosolanacearum]
LSTSLSSTTHRIGMQTSSDCLHSKRFNFQSVYREHLGIAACHKPISLIRPGFIIPFHIIRAFAGDKRWQTTFLSKTFL